MCTNRNRAVRILKRILEPVLKIRLIKIVRLQLKRLTLVVWRAGDSYILYNELVEGVCVCVCIIRTSFLILNFF